MNETRSDVRARYEIARDYLRAMRTSTTSAEFSVALLGFLTFGRSVLDVARAEAASHGIRQPTKHRVEAAEDEPLVKFFIGARNDALKQSRYERMRATVTVESATAIRLHIISGDVLISPSRGIDESREPSRVDETLEIEVREGKPTATNIPASVKQEYYLASGAHSGENVIDLSEQYLARLETIVEQVEQSIATDTSSGSVR